ncbi:MAG TPA: hypothetical protein VGL77_15425 [Armatimonadota bacterium]|jgi:hypothetical protein
MRKLLAMGIGALLWSVASLAFAYPTLVGPTGGATLPTGDITPSRIDVAGDFYDTTGQQTYPVRGLFSYGSWELGGAYTFNRADNVWGVNGKYNFPIGGHPDFALGAIYTQQQHTDVNATSVYLVHTHPFSGGHMAMTQMANPTGLRGNIGIDWTSVDFKPGTHTALRAFIGADYTFADRLSIAAEYQTKSGRLREDRALSSLVVRYPFSALLGAEVGVSNVSPLGLFGGDDHRLFAGINITFGGSAGAATSSTGMPMTPSRY